MIPATTDAASRALYFLSSRIGSIVTVLGADDGPAAWALSGGAAGGRMAAGAVVMAEFLGSSDLSQLRPGAGRVRAPSSQGGDALVQIGQFLLGRGVH